MYSSSLSKPEKKQDDQTFSILNRADIQISKMATMIKGFLDVSRLEAGKINLDRHPVDLNTLIADVIEDLTIVSNTHAIKTFPCQPLVVNVDADKISSVISNLLSNAVKYSAAGTNIEIRCESVGDFAQISVKDEGLGIRPSDIERLFERFYRVEDTGSMIISGFGVGLYLCAEIIERHGGKIGVDSKYGEGSTFHFLLPLH